MKYEQNVMPLIMVPIVLAVIESDILDNHIRARSVIA